MPDQILDPERVHDFEFHLIRLYGNPLQAWSIQDVVENLIFLEVAPAAPTDQNEGQLICVNHLSQNENICLQVLLRTPNNKAS